MTEPDGWCDRCKQKVWTRSDGTTLMGHPCATDSPASVSPEQTPTPTADSAHSGDYLTVQNKENP